MMGVNCQVRHSRTWPCGAGSTWFLSSSSPAALRRGIFTNSFPDTVNTEPGKLSAPVCLQNLHAFMVPLWSDLFPGEARAALPIFCFLCSLCCPWNRNATWGQSVRSRVLRAPHPSSPSCPSLIHSTLLCYNPEIVCRGGRANSFAIFTAATLRVT